MEYRVLGPLEVVSRGRPLELGGPRQRALLALLLLHANEVVSADRLIDELWPHEPPHTGRAALRVRISQLRKVLGPDALVTRSPGYLIAVDPERFDLRRFERLAEESGRALEASEPARARELAREALELWRGPALGDVVELDIARVEAARLEELRLAVLERRIDAELALGRHEDVVGELESLLARQPHRERLAGQLMLALYRSGRQADALDVFQRTRARLVDELGIEPGAALRELQASILRQEPALAPVSAVEPSPPARSLLLVLDDRAELVCRLGEALAKDPPRELILARLVSEPDHLLDATRALHRVRDGLLERGRQARAAAFTTAEPGEEIVRLAAQQGAELVVLGVSAAQLAELPRGELGVVLDRAPCDVAVASGSAEERVGPVLVPFSGAEHDWTAVEIAAWLAHSTGSALVLAGRSRTGRRHRDASRLLASASLIVQQVAGVAAEPLLVDDADGLVAAGDRAQVVVLGLSDRWRREGLGRARAAVAGAVAAPVLVTRRGLRPGGLSPPEGLTRFTWTLGKSARAAS